MKRLVVFLVLLASVLSIKAAEMYVEVSPDGSTITFYYDDLKSSREGTVYEIDENSESEKNWLHFLFYNEEEVMNITTAVFDSSFANARPTSTERWFCELINLQSIENIQYLNTSEVTYMGEMFYGCSSLSRIDVTHFDTSKVTDMHWMFGGCSSLEYVNVGNFNTHNVRSMWGMFDLCSSLRYTDVSHFDTSNVEDIAGLFRECWNLVEIDVSHFDTHNVKEMSYMFWNCGHLLSLDVSHFDTSNVTNMMGMFYRCLSLQNLDLSNFNTSKVTQMNEMFLGCWSLEGLDLSNFDTSKVTNMEGMFSGCSYLGYLDISNFDMSKVTDGFSICSGVASEEDPCLLWKGGYFRLPETDKLKVEPVTVLKGSPSTMAIELKNPSSKKYIGYQFNILLPEGVSICKKDNGQYSYTQGNRYGNTQMMINIREQNDGSYMVLCFSLSNTPISGHEGAILSLDITSDGSLDDGIYEGAIRGIKFSTTEDADALLPDATFKVNVSKYELGDVNNDGSVSITDITMAVNYILGKASDKFHASHGDMNHDGEINISDLSEMVEIILNSYNNAPVNIGVTGGLRMESAGSECSLYLPDAGLYKGCQFLVRVPSGCRLSDVSVGAGRELGHRVMFRQTGTGLYKVLVFSADGDEFEDVPSALLRLTVDGQNGGAVELSDIRFTDTDFTEHGFAAVSSEVTGIGAVAKGASESTWYSLDGQKTAQPTKGVFVRDGKKMVVK